MNTLFANLHWTNLLIIPGLLLGYTVHELGHAFAAYFLGDHSQVEQGRLTLNPLAHISWLGGLFFVLFGLGWPKPLRVSPHNLRRGHQDMIWVALAGPAASFTFGLVGLLLTLAVAALLVYMGDFTTDKVFSFLFPLRRDMPPSLNSQAWLMAFTSYLFTASFWLTVVSLLPVPGLDGFAAVQSLLILLRQGQTGQGRSRVEPVVADTPMTLAHQRRRRNNAAEIHFKAGADYHQANQIEDAVARYRQAIRSDQNFGPAYVNLGLAYLAEGRRKDAIQAFRGAVQNADDRKSQSEAWQQLHQLSEVSPVDKEAAQESMARMGAAPWTDTHPRPNWLSLAIGAGLLLVGGILLYVLLLSQVIALLKA